MQTSLHTIHAVSDNQENQHVKTLITLWCI
uniref:Uncharacterized protein n=1 Tax=Anguilla anguilla TaxID=7936 RepID=A0A0E9PDV5_ANGAN